MELTREEQKLIKDAEDKIGKEITVDQNTRNDVRISIDKHCHGGKWRIWADSIEAACEDAVRKYGTTG